jgi:hypothetical protein
VRALAPGESRAARTDHGEQHAAAAPIFARSRAGRRALQAYRFGAKFSTPAQALLLALTNGEHRTILEIEGCNATLLAKCLIIATGRITIV